jgi:hypothetical protein
MAMLLDLSYTPLKQSQFNTVVVQQKEMDRVGFEPTASAMPAVDRKRIISRMTITIEP